MDDVEEAVIEAPARPELTTYEDLAGRIEHQMLSPALHEDQIIDACRMSWECGLGAICVRPTDVDTAVRILGSAPVKIGSVAGFPHGTSTTATKLYEGRDLLRRGAKEVSLMVNVSKMISRQFQHVEVEIRQMADSCIENGATLKVIYETGVMTEEMIIILSKIVKRTGTRVAVASTGYGPPYTMDHLKLMRRILRDQADLQAGAKSLEDALKLYDAGCDRISTTAAEPMVTEWKRVLAERAKAAAGELETPAPVSFPRSTVIRS